MLIDPSEKDMPAADPNKIFLQVGKITVTASRFNSGTETYLIKKISGVRVESEKRHTRVAIALMLLGVALLAGGLLANLGMLIMLGAALAVGGAMLCFAKLNRTIVLTTRGADERAVTSKDVAMIQSIASALREAMAARNSR